MKRPRVTRTSARQTIFSQPGFSQAVKRSAWRLFEHEIDCKGQHATLQAALGNVLRWMDDQAKKTARSRHKPSTIDRQMLQELVNGKTQKQIAYRFGFKLKTVHVRFWRLRERLGVETMYQVIALCVKQGWVRVDIHVPDKSQT